MRAFLIAAISLVVAACAGSPPRDLQPTNATLLSAAGMQDSSPGALDSSYIIGAADVLSISVFRVPDLSFDEIRVDSQGDLQIPLIGSVRAAGQTTTSLAAELEGRLSERYLQNPRVTVTVGEAASQKVTIDGAVTKPGVYELRGRTTLLQAVAMASGPSPTANLESVAVFRNQDGQRMVAVFDVAAIRDGNASDPVIEGDDIVIVDTSRLRSFMRDAVAALPALAVFARY